MYNAANPSITKWTYDDEDYYIGSRVKLLRVARGSKTTWSSREHVSPGDLGTVESFYDQATPIGLNVRWDSGAVDDVSLLWVELLPTLLCAECDQPVSQDYLCGACRA